MSALAVQWAQLASRFAALSRRERAIVAAAVIFGGGLLIFNLGIDPLLTKARGASRAEAAARADLAQQQALAVMLQAQNADPDAANRSRMAKAKQELTAVSTRLASFEAGMVPPERMQAFLEALLSTNRNIELRGLKTLPVTLVGAQLAVPKSEAAAGPGAQSARDSNPDKAAAAAMPVSADGIYQHGIEIRLAGTYNDLLNYLFELESMPQRVMWHSISLTVERYPRNLLVLRVFTLSLDRNWLVV